MFEPGKPGVTGSPGSFGVGSLEDREGVVGTTDPTGEMLAWIEGEVPWSQRASTDEYHEYAADEDEWDHGLGEIEGEE